MSTLQAILVLAAEAGGHESSKTLYYVLGGALALFACVVSAIGIRGHETWPRTEGTKKAVLLLAMLFTVGAMASSIITS